MFLQTIWIVMSCTCIRRKDTVSRTIMGLQSLFTFREKHVRLCWYNLVFVFWINIYFTRIVNYENSSPAASWCRHSFVHFVINSNLKSTLPPSDSPSSCASGDEARRQAWLDTVFFPQRKGISTGLLLTTSTRGGSGSMQQRAGDHFGPLNYNQ